MNSNYVSSKLLYSICAIRGEVSHITPMHDLVRRIGDRQEDSDVRLVNMKLRPAASYVSITQTNSLPGSGLKYHNQPTRTSWRLQRVTAQGLMGWTHWLPPWQIILLFISGPMFTGNWCKKTFIDDY